MLKNIIKTILNSYFINLECCNLYTIEKSIETIINLIEGLGWLLN